MKARLGQDKEKNSKNKHKKVYKTAKNTKFFKEPYLCAKKKL